MIDLQALLVVAAASILGAATVVTLCSVGLRLLVTRTVIVGDDGRRDDGARRAARRRPLAATIGAYTCFAACGATVLVAIYLIVPSLHG